MIKGTVSKNLKLSSTKNFTPTIGIKDNMLQDDWQQYGKAFDTRKIALVVFSKAVFRNVDVNNSESTFWHLLCCW